MGTNYHNEALRKARIMERKNDARLSKEIPLGSTGATGSFHIAADVEKQQIYQAVGSDSRVQPKTLRLRQDGCHNRYRAGNEKPHVDAIYGVMYPEKDNSTYTDDPCRNNRRINIKTDSYDALRKVNGSAQAAFPNKRQMELSRRL